MVSLVRDVISGLFPDFISKRETVMNIYSLYDRKLREFGPLVVSNNDESVVRALREGLPGSGGTVNKYPEDFDLMCLGALDVDTGLIVPERVPLLVVNVRSALTPPEGGS